MEESKFDAIGKSKEKLLEFFRANFEDVVGFIGEEKLVEQYFTNPRLPLISVKVISPFSPVVSLLPFLIKVEFQPLLDADIHNRKSAIPTTTRTAA